MTDKRRTLQIDRQVHWQIHQINNQKFFRLIDNEFSDWLTKIFQINIIIRLIEKKIIRVIETDKVTNQSIRLSDTPLTDSYLVDKNNFIWHIDSATYNDKFNKNDRHTDKFIRQADRQTLTKSWDWQTNWQIHNCQKDENDKFIRLADKITNNKDKLPNFFGKF